MHWLNNETELEDFNFFNFSLTMADKHTGLHTLMSMLQMIMVLLKSYVILEEEQIFSMQFLRIFKLSYFTSTYIIVFVIHTLTPMVFHITKMKKITPAHSL